MYYTILLALDASSTDRPIIEHIKQLAGILHSRVVLLHVATGTAVQFHGADAAGKEVEDSRTYLARVRDEFVAAQIPVAAELRYGKPAKEIVKCVTEKACDLVAMGTHGHRFLGDVFLGTTASPVQHNVNVPVLMLRAQK